MTVAAIGRIQQVYPQQLRGRLMAYNMQAAVDSEHSLIRSEHRCARPRRQSVSAADGRSGEGRAWDRQLLHRG